MVNWQRSISQWELLAVATQPRRLQFKKKQTNKNQSKQRTFASFSCLACFVSVLSSARRSVTFCCRESTSCCWNSSNCFSSV